MGALLQTESLFSLGTLIISFFGRFRAVHENDHGMALLRLFYNGLCAIGTGRRLQVQAEGYKTIPGPGGPLRLRLYRGCGGNALPAVIFFHGGAFCVGDLNSHDASARALANAASCLVIVVDYRLAPEHTYPAAAADAYCALQWVASNATDLGIDRQRLIVAGDSAGGALAAVVCRWARERGGAKIALQILIYPMTDSSMGTASWQQFANGPGLNYGAMAAAWRRYAPNAHERSSADVSPLAAGDLRGLPPALVITAENDPLRDEGEAYAMALRDNRVSVSLKRYPGATHGFFQIPHSQSGRKALADIARVLADRFESAPAAV